MIALGASLYSFISSASSQPATGFDTDLGDQKINPMMMGCNTDGDLTFMAVGIARVGHSFDASGNDNFVTLKSLDTNFDHVFATLAQNGGGDPYNKITHIHVDFPIQREGNNTDVITIRFHADRNGDAGQIDTVSYVLAITNKSSDCKVTQPK
jgi:hypothetical protein